MNPDLQRAREKLDHAWSILDTMIPSSPAHDDEERDERSIEIARECIDHVEDAIDALDLSPSEFNSLVTNLEFG